MKKNLILSYYYPPCNGVAAFRPISWFKYFPDRGIYPIVITRHWKGNESKWTDFLLENTGTEKSSIEEQGATYYLPYRKHWALRLAENIFIQKIKLSKVIHLFLLLSGRLQVEVGAYWCFKKKAEQIIESDKIDALIVTSPPLNLIRLAYELNRKYKIPFYVDFRDSWNNMQLIDNYKPGLKESFFNKLSEYYLKKWLKKSQRVITVTPIISEKLLRKLNVKSDVITNGYEQDLLESLYVDADKTKFRISVIGTIHPMQDISVLLAGLKIFLQDKHEEVELGFYGVGSFESVLGLIKKELPFKNIIFTPRIPRKEAITEMFKSSVLIFPSYPQYRDYYTAKVFEYLGSQRNILMVPANHDLVDKLIADSKSGKIASNPQEVNEFLSDWLKEFKDKGSISYYGDQSYIRGFSRQKLAYDFADLIIPTC